MGFNMSNFQETAEFSAAMHTLTTLAGRSKVKSDVAGECSALAMRSQADIAALYRVTGAWDKDHNPNADETAGEIRAALKASGLKPDRIKGYCKDALALCRHESFDGCESGDAFVSAFAELELKTAKAVGDYARGVVADPVKALADKVAKLDPADRKRFDGLLRAATLAAKAEGHVKGVESIEKAA